jgi:hypothetical protein
LIKTGRVDILIFLLLSQEMVLFFPI